MSSGVVRFLASPNFLNYWLPLITVFVAVFFKAIGRSDRHGIFRREDLSIGVDLCVASIFAFAIKTALLAKRSAGFAVILSPAELDLLAISPLILLGMVLGLIFVTTITRLFGWSSSKELKWIGGIIIPSLYGVVVLSMVARLISE